MMVFKLKDKLVMAVLATLLTVLASGNLRGQVGTDSHYERYQRFSKGINLPFWFWLNKGELQPLEKRFSDGDLELIKNLGLTFVRVPVDMANIYSPDREDLLQPEALELITAGIKRIIGHGLAVNFDLHSISQYEGGSNYSGPLGKDPAFTEKFFLFWEKLAEKLAIFEPDWLLIEPMNEPVFQGEEQLWPPIQRELISRIRGKLPNHTILATGALWSNLNTLLTLEPLDDPQVWYCFHYYEPHIFTHQGATWSSEWVKSLRLIPYPSSPEAVSRALSRVSREDVKSYLRAYGEERWNAGKIEQRVEKAADWAQEHRVRLICNEFGAYRVYCLPPYRITWLHDVRAALEKHEIGWAMWEFDGTFGLVYRKSGRAVVDKKAAAALGLKVD
jgi:hypothetical protein